MFQRLLEFHLTKAFSRAVRNEPAIECIRRKPRVLHGGGERGRSGGDHSGDFAVKEKRARQSRHKQRNVGFHRCPPVVTTRPKCVIQLTKARACKPLLYSEAWEILRATKRLDPNGCILDEKDRPKAKHNVDLSQRVLQELPRP